MIKEFIPATRIVRAVLRKHGISSVDIYTNDYKKCKTIKTYLNLLPGLVEVSGDIRRCLIEAGVTGFDIKTRTHYTSYGPGRLAYIVRLPKE